ncbi:MAG: TRAP transporter small permease [Hyphomicrobiales bacterium]|nr:TRAP transporter small permease [Hyphomicrobiales bacterium]
MMTATATQGTGPASGAGNGGGGPLAAFDRYFGGLTSVMNMIGTIWIVVMTVLVVADVIGLNFFHHSVPAVKEFIQLSIPGIVFLQLANTLREDRHVSSDIFITKLRRGSPRLASFTYAMFNLIGMALMIFLAWRIYPKALQAYTENFTRGHSGMLTLPEWPSMALVVFGSAMMGIQYGLMSIRDFIDALTGAHAPHQEGGNAL